MRVNGIERLSPAVVAARTQQLQESDPQIYVEIHERRDEMPSKSVFILQNHGGSVARNVRIEPLRLPVGEATFEPVDHIAEKRHREVVPTIENFGVLQKHNLGHLLVKEWDSAGEPTDEFVYPIRVVYDDYADRKFETTFNMVFHAVRFTIRDNHSSAWPGNQRPIFEIRDTKVKPLP